MAEKVDDTPTCQFGGLKFRSRRDPRWVRASRFSATSEKMFCSHQQPRSLRVIYGANPPDAPPSQCGAALESLGEIMVLRLHGSALVRSPGDIEGY